MKKSSKRNTSAEPLTVLRSEKDKLQLTLIEQQKEIEELKSRLDTVASGESFDSAELEEMKRELESQRLIAIESMKKNIALEEHLLSSIENEERLLLSYKKLVRQY